ncbi:uncharacterized protein LOC122262348 isoform X2 [Penaeus japonicus]|uniref:uncharacterized protein LOC122262348 isoform X2 n=1 Tax=Penaeus japonicus TaxID=27405 RepID=UPI001C713686|nr:uncharacterized protein LOC122262348 isoform X2 [Penaeus japonicus]
MHLHIPTFLLALGLTLRTAEALYIEPGCVVRSHSEADLSWPDIHISVWIPGAETTALDLTVTFKGHDAEVTRDKITINSTGIFQKMIREINPENVFHPFQQDYREGWNDYKFSVKDYSIISLADNRSVSLNVSKDHEPSHVKISGSNVTINCFSEYRVWNVTRTPLIVPLDGRSDEFLSIFSRYKVVPTLTLGREEVRLYRGDNRSLTVDGSLPLPAFEDHNFTLSFTPGSSTFENCFIKSGGGNVIQVPVAKDLRHKLVVKSNDGSQFFLLQQKSANSVELLASHQSSAGDSHTVVSLSVFLVLAILGITVLLLYISRLKKKMKKKKENVDVEEPLLYRSQELVYKKPSSLLSAVAEDKDIQIMALPCTEDFDSALIEAHLLRRTNLLPFLKTRSKLGENEVITKVLKEYHRREDEIMEAAKKGNYRRGVNTLLWQYELPASLRDDGGKTILHHAASVKDDFGAPLWTADNLRSLLTSPFCYFNAVDYHGRTCLHLLARASGTSTKIVTFDGHEVTVSEAWLMMAKILVTCGCRPGPDYSGVFPHETAKQNGHHGLATYLEKIHQDSASPTRTDASLFKELVTAAQENKVVEVRNLLQRKSHLLPLDARDDPLTEAVRRGHLEVAMLLLSAGAPLCARPLVSITPLEVAHSKADLPALLPAILRKECVNKLKHEANSIKGGANVRLQENIEEFAANINDEGPKARWKFIRDSADKRTQSETARELLCTAANLGLSFTCQMFGLEDVHLHPLPREENPVSSALKGRKEDTLYVLFRDLNMSLSVGNESELPEEFLAEVLDNEIKNFKKYCRTMKDLAGDNANSLEKELDGALKGSLKGRISKGAMFIISRFGLVSLLKKLREHVPVNTVIDDLTGFTMLHISALYGMLDMVEYLLYNGAIIETKSKDGFTAENVAAMKGNKECMDYLHIYHKQLLERGSTVSNNDLTLDALSNGYQAQVGAFSTLLLPEESGIEVLSEPQEDTRTALLLRKKTEELGISNNKSFRTFIQKWRTNPESENVIEDEMENLLREMGGKPNSRFKGKMIRRHLEAIPAGNVPYDSLQVYWQVDYETYEGFRIKHSNGDNSKCSLDVCLSDGTQSPCIQSFKENFFAEIKETLLTYKFKTPNVWLTYPSVYMMFIGVTIYLLWFDDEGRTRQVRVLIVPVLKADYPEDTNPLPPFVDEGLREGASVYITSTGEGRPWTYVMTQLEDMILSQLAEEKKLVFLACQFLEAILNPCWWFPRLQSRRHGRTWKSYAVSLSGLADIRQLLTLFLEEVSQTQEEDWKPSMFLNRVLSVYQRATLEDEVRSDIKIFLDPKHGAFTPFKRVLPITEFLKEMLQNPSSLSVA